MVGDYNFLKGNSPLLGLKALTGATQKELLSLSCKERDEWKCTSVSFEQLPSADVAHGSRTLHWEDWPDGCAGHETKTLEEAFGWLAEYDEQNYLLCACSDTAGGDDTNKSEGGVVQSHAYTIIQIAKDVAGSGVDLMHLRNPWGRQEWNGDWSDGSSTWDDHPEVKEALKPEFGDDGTFWMTKEDFVTQYCRVYVCKVNMGENRGKQEKNAQAAEDQKDHDDAGEPAITRSEKKAASERRKAKAKKAVEAECSHEGMLSVGPDGGGELELDENAWPARIHSKVQLDENNFPIQSISAECCGADQGFGGTGDAKMVVALLDPDNAVKAWSPIGTVSHDWECVENEFEADDAIIAGAAAGDSLAIVMLSPPWPGWSCRCTDSH
eukprot:gnl/MRDRNA2_/MRDRNA2_86159_c0_seq1.p1 gnl/MRDRNA2_/MRDRNA2_86159_c0~~gnl/MRDRNA2_/MRDRNA2_86159_c0_seq1.p1  ORF type:complete len:425 (-),score=91.12 gnl/MRDRNA2_/MRDRNA2_86159_c0_seq1:1123-2268(-)